MNKSTVTIFLWVYLLLCLLMAWKPEKIGKINERFLRFYWKLFGYEVTLRKIHPHRGERITQVWALLCALFATFFLGLIHLGELK